MNKARCNNDGPHNIKTVKEVNCSETYRESEDESIVTKANVITIIIPTKNDVLIIQGKFSEQTLKHNKEAFKYSLNHNNKTYYLLTTTLSLDHQKGISKIS